MLFRSLTLLKPPTQQEFEATLRWMAERGKEEELILIHKIKNNLPYSSEAIQSLLKATIKKIEDRLKKQSIELGKYRIFCAENEVKNFSSKVYVVQSYPAFTVILGFNYTVSELQKCYPVEKLPSQEDIEAHSNQQTINEPSEITAIKKQLKEAQMRDQVVRFNAPVLESWKRRIEEIGAKILQPLGGSEFVVSVPDEDKINQIRNLKEVAGVTPYIPQIRIQPQHLQNLGQTATPEVIAAARLRIAKNPPSSRNRSLSLPGIFIANFFTEEDRNQAAENLQTEGIRIADRPGTNKLVLDLSSDPNAIESLTKISQQAGLQSLSEKTIPKLFNNPA